MCKKKKKFAFEKSKYCNVNIFQLSNFCDLRIPNQKLYLCKILSLQKKPDIVPLFYLFFSLFGEI